MPEVPQSVLDDLTRRAARGDKLRKALDGARREIRLTKQQLRQTSKPGEGSGVAEPARPASPPAPAKPDGDVESRAAQAERALRVYQVRDAFAARARAKHASPDRVNDLYGIFLSEAGDVGSIDPSKPESFDAFIDASASSRSWAFSPPTAGGNGTTAGPAQVPGFVPPSSGRSASDPPSGLVEYRAADVAHPDWKTNRPDLVTALKEGRAKMVGD